MKGSAMASPARIDKMVTLEEFLRMPEIDEHPYLEYIDGRIEAKVSPQLQHGVLTTFLLNHLLEYARPQRRGLPVPELRCTFAGRSIIPDVVFLLDAHIETDKNGKLINPIFRPPDIHVEIVSPDQSARKCREKLAFSRANGCPLGWLIDPERMRVLVYRPGRRAKELPDDGVLEGDPVLPGYRLPVAELFDWLIWRKPDRKPSSPQSQDPTPGEPS
jgi:Uma2 family endonuclease